MKRNKILWVVIVGLMVLDLAVMTIGRGVGMLILLDKFFGTIGMQPSNWLMLFPLFLPTLAICTLISVTKQYKRFWLAAIPSLMAFVIWCITIFDLNEGWWIIWLIIKTLPTCMIVVMFYLAVFVVKKIKNKKGEDTSC